MPQHRLSTRNVKGRGWGKKGYRQDGRMCIMLKHSYADFSRGEWVNENSTISDLIMQLHHSVQGGDGLPPTLRLRFYYRRQVLLPSDDMVKTKMDGGETVYAKAFDDDDREYRTDCRSWYPASERRSAGVSAYFER